MPGRRGTADDLGQHDDNTGPHLAAGSHLAAVPPLAAGSHLATGSHLAAESQANDEQAADQFLAEARADRWHWRRKIRANPVQRRIYRVVVGIAGLLLIVLGLVTGPIPGPGGIPLILLGLAIWASEFERAHRLMQVFKAQLRRFQSWTRLQQVAFWAIFISCCGLCGYVSMLLLGVPTWVPSSAEMLLQRLPGL